MIWTEALLRFFVGVSIMDHDYYIKFQIFILHILSELRFVFLRNALDLDPRNHADFCFYLFLYTYFVFNSKLVYIIIYMCISIFKT